MLSVNTLWRPQNRQPNALKTNDNKARLSNTHKTPQDKGQLRNNEVGELQLQRIHTHTDKLANTPPKKNTNGHQAQFYCTHKRDGRSNTSHHPLSQRTRIHSPFITLCHLSLLSPYPHLHTEYILLLDRDTRETQQKTFSHQQTTPLSLQTNYPPQPRKLSLTPLHQNSVVIEVDRQSRSLALDILVEVDRIRQKTPASRETSAKANRKLRSKKAKHKQRSSRTRGGLRSRGTRGVLWSGRLRPSNTKRTCIRGASSRAVAAPTQGRSSNGHPQRTITPTHDTLRPGSIRTIASTRFFTLRIKAYFVSEMLCKMFKNPGLSTILSTPHSVSLNTTTVGVWLGISHTNNNYALQNIISLQTKLTKAIPNCLE